MTKQPKWVEELQAKYIPPHQLKMDTPISDIADLPFVTTLKKSRKFWDCKSTGIPGASGTFFADCDLGREYGRLYVNHLISDTDLPLPITWIVKGMNNLEDETHGIAVGFLFVLQELAQIGAKAVQMMQTEKAPATKTSPQDNAARA